MSHRLQVLVPEELQSRIRKAAQRLGIANGEWVRRAIELALRAPRGDPAAISDPLARLEALEGPTGDVETMLREIESGRR